MDNRRTDPERIRYQTDRLVTLSGRGRRIALLRRFARRRAVPRGGDQLPQRVPLRLVSPLRRDADPVLVVPGQVLLSGDDGQRAMSVLASYGLDAQVQPKGDRDSSAVLDVTDSVDIATVLRLLRHHDLDASANHAAAHSGRSKGGSTPKNTEVTPASPRQPDTPVSPEPLVIVIDTGMDTAALEQARLAEDNRTDSWLDSVQVDDAGHDIDLLDTEDYVGNDGPDGFLDLGAGHGTFVAGVIRSRAPTANILMLRALDTDGYGSEKAVERAINRARELFEEETGPGLLNLSLGIETLDGLQPVGIRDAIAALPDDVLVVAAAGNGPTGIPVWPAAFDDRVLGVGSVKRTPTGQLTPSDWSNHGDWVDFSAIGEGVISTFVAGTETEGSGAEDDPFDPDPDTFDGPNAYALWSGTSFATAKVTGELASYLIAHPGDVGGAVPDLRGRGQTMSGYGVVVDL